MSKLMFTREERSVVHELLGVILGNEHNIECLADLKDDNNFNCYFIETVLNAAKRALVVAAVYNLKVNGRGGKAA